MAWSDGLTGQPREIAASSARRLRVRAGPGTGKTYALMRRIARLLEEGVSPRRILVCTFTRVAAEDLKKALSELDASRVDLVQATTIHSFCFRMLLRKHVLAATGRTARPLLDYETRFLLEDLGSRFGKLNARRKLLQAYEAAWARCQDELPGFPDESRDRAFHAALRYWLRFHKAMLLGELVPEALRYLENNPLAAERRSFDHVVVDEYQDLNVAEQVVIDILAREGNLSIVGDENQSIYSFKHAHPSGLRDFDRRHEETVDRSLRICRRCPSRVLSMANSLIRKNQVQSEQELRPYSDARVGRVRIVQWPTIKDEATGLAKVIRRSILNGEVNAGNVLVLAPSRVFANPIRDALQCVGVPAESLFREKELDGSRGERGNPRAEEALTLLQLTVDPEDRVALRCWCGLATRTSFGSTPWSKVRGHCEDQGRPLVDVLEDVREERLKWRGSWRVRDRLRKLEQKLGALKGLEGSGLVDAVLPNGDQDLAALRSTAQEILQETEEPLDPADLVKRARQRVGQPELPTEVEYVRMMSLHKSKGLTVGMVVVAGLVEGVLPRINLEDDGKTRRESLEEQRRLLYVAITRTTNVLILSSVVRLRGEDAYKLGIPGIGRGRVRSVQASRLVAELGPETPPAISGEELVREWHASGSAGID